MRFISIYFVPKYGNTSAASMLILLHETLDKKLINKGDIIMILGFGAGMSSSIIIFKYNYSYNLLDIFSSSDLPFGFAGTPKFKLKIIFQNQNGIVIQKY